MSRLLAAIVLAAAISIAGPAKQAQAALCPGYRVTTTAAVNGNWTATITPSETIVSVYYVSLWNIGGVNGGDLNGTNQISGIVYRLDPSKGYTLEINIFDNCGMWRTFVGSGRPYP